MNKSELWNKTRAFAFGSQLPMPDPELERKNQAVYSDYLSEFGLTEQEVLPQVEWDHLSDTKKNDILQLLGRGISDGLASKDNDLLRVVLPMLAEYVDPGNANRLINQVLFKLKTEIVASGTAVPNVAVGIFPIHSFNGHCIEHLGMPLILVNNGALLMLECAGLVLAAEKLRPPDEQVELLMRFADDYCSSGRVPNSTKADHPKIWSRIWTPMLITCSEEFLLAHELGHICLGHVEATPSFAIASSTARPVHVIEKPKHEELMADAWAIMKLIDRCGAERRINSLALDMAAAGPLIFLGTTLLIEETYRTKGTSLPDCHPSAALRLYAAECLLEVLGLESELNAGRHYLEHVKTCLKRLGSDRYPPLLSRELNRLVCPVFDELEIHNERSRMVRKFV